MASIKKFFEKKKAEYKFKKAGPGHKLSQSSEPQSSKPGRGLPSTSRPREELSGEAKRAAAAALARFEQNEQTSAEAVMAGRSLAAIRAEAKKELDKEKNLVMTTGVTSNILQNPPKQQEFEGAPALAVNGVYFTCPLIGPEVLPRPEMEKKIKEFLYDQLTEERGLTSCLIIHTCNKNQEKVQTCIDTLTKYLDNILMHPTEEKYRKIKMSNKIFQERVASVEGTLDFLIAAGFEKQTLTVSDDVQEEFWVFTPQNDEEIDALTALKEGLQNAEPILPELDRGLQVLRLKSTANINLPSEFYNITKEELKREQELRKQQVELDTQLRTKAMREKDEMREKRRYRYTLIRIRFPDGVHLQGTFKVREKVLDLKSFIRENLEFEWMPFNITSATGQLINDDETTLVDLHLIPAAIIHFNLDQSIIEDIQAQQGGNSIKYLKSETMDLLQEK